MKQIERFDALNKSTASAAERSEVSSNLLRAYYLSRYRGTEHLDFCEDIYDHQIPQIVKNCQEEGIDTITISSRYSSLTWTLWHFVENGCEVVGMTMVPREYIWGEDYINENPPTMPAVVLKIKKAN